MEEFVKLEYITDFLKNKNIEWNGKICKYGSFDEDKNYNIAEVEYFEKVFDSPYGLPVILTENSKQPCRYFLHIKPENFVIYKEKNFSIKDEKGLVLNLYKNFSEDWVGYLLEKNSSDYANHIVTYANKQKEYLNNQYLAAIDLAGERDDLKEMKAKYFEYYDGLITLAKNFNNQKV